MDHLPGKGQRLVKYDAKEEMLTKELPPEENPNENAYKPKTFASIGKPKPSEQREGEEDLASLDVDPSKENLAAAVELPKPDPRFNASSITQICKKKNIVWRDKLNINF